MSKFTFAFESYLASVEEVIEQWFQKHFGHITPGTPDHAVATAAKADLVTTLGGKPAAAPEAAPVQPEPRPEPAPEPQPEPERSPEPEEPAVPEDAAEPEEHA